MSAKDETEDASTAASSALSRLLYTWLMLCDPVLSRVYALCPRARRSAPACQNKCNGRLGSGAHGLVIGSCRRPTRRLAFRLDA